jgi:hypothetical protein
MSRVDAVVFGTGEYCARILFDLAASTSEKVSVLIVGRDAARLAWLRTAANGRAAIFGTQARFTTEVLPDFRDELLEDILSRTKPSVVLQTASLQTASVLWNTSSRWSRLIALGGLSVTAPIHAVLSYRVGQAIARTNLKTHFVNACFPDVTNRILKLLGVPILCGVGNIGTLASAFAGDSGVRASGRIKMLAHFEHLGIWRKPPEERSGIVPRVWIDNTEVIDVFDRFRGVMLSPQLAFEISGATNVPMIIALATSQSWEGHAPGVHGLPGGYPVHLDAGGTMNLSLPEGITTADATAWNESFDRTSGLIFDPDGSGHFTGRLRHMLAEEEFPYSDGFRVEETVAVARAIIKLRDHLLAIPAGRPERLRPT